MSVLLALCSLASSLVFRAINGVPAHATGRAREMPAKQAGKKHHADRHSCDPHQGTLTIKNLLPSLPKVVTFFDGEVSLIMPFLIASRLDFATTDGPTTREEDCNLMIHREALRTY